MNFFKPEDFVFSSHPEITSNKFTQMTAANLANAKLQKEGKVVIGNMEFGFATNGLKNNWGTHKALLICIDPIVKCEHPVEKVNAVVLEGWDKTKSTSFCNITSFQCECGAKVKPSGFKESGKHGS